MKNQTFSWIPGIGAICILFLRVFDCITVDTFYICLSILLSANAIILALGKYDEETKNKK